MAEDKLPYEFDGVQQKPSIIKIIGVGGGGGNAVNHMYKEGIQDVTFVLCNTDSQSLNDSDIPYKVQLGEGLGAGNRPDLGRQAAEQSVDKIKELFTDGTKMVFVTAGMGGGTGTGAGPVIAKVAKDLDILTVGIVTIPFLFEGNRKIMRAWEGVKEMEQNVDALLVINNENLRKIYSDLDFLNAFSKADDILTIAAKSIAEIVAIKGYINLDFADVNTTLKNGGKAIMSAGYGTGEHRVSKAIEDALNSPLLNDDEIYNAKKILFNLYFSNIKMEEMNEVNAFMARFEKDFDIKWGVTIDETLGDTVKIIFLASGFREENNAKESEELGSHPTSDSRSENQDDIRIRLYGTGAIMEQETIQGRAFYKILKVDEMDDDTTLEELDKEPTYKRKQMAVNHRTDNKVPTKETAQQPDSADNAGTGKIIF